MSRMVRSKYVQKRRRRRDMAEKEQTLEKLFTQLEDVIREMEQG